MKTMRTNLVTPFILFAVLAAGCGNGQNGGSDAADGTEEAGSELPPVDGQDIDIGEDISPVDRVDVPPDDDDWVENPPCADPVPPRALTVHTGGGTPLSFGEGGFVVLTGLAPADVGGTPVDGVRVNGSTRNVHFDGASGVWSWMRLLMGFDADIIVEAVDAAGNPLQSMAVHVTTGAGHPDMGAASFEPWQHIIGTWMFTWFTGPGSRWECSSPWVPVETFDAWDGSPGWARKQILDQMDAGIDVTGLQLDTLSPSPPSGYRWTNVRNAIEGARTLLEDGMAPPKIFPLIDTAIIADIFLTQNGRTLDLSRPEDLDFLYSFMTTFYDAFNEVMGGVFSDFEKAMMGGRPYVAFWHSVTIDGENDAVIAELKSRFASRYGVEPYLIAHPNDWNLYPGIDEITLMFGPPQHFFSGGRDSNGGETINIEAGFWNPISNTFYLPRAGGVNFLPAWDQAMAMRGSVEHLYIDSWNETGEGSGIFEAQTVTYIASDAGPCGEFVNRHDESWGSESRYYIHVTSERAIAWKDVLPLDSTFVADDLPASLHPGERRWVSIFVRNAGSSPWGNDAAVMLEPSGDSGAFLIGPQALVLGTGELRHVGRIPPGAAAAFQFLLTAPCIAGIYDLSFQLVASGAPFGFDLSKVISVGE